jgi:hypothetical protein
LEPPSAIALVNYNFPQHMKQPANIIIARRVEMAVGAETVAAMTGLETA